MWFNHEIYDLKKGAGRRLAFVDLAKCIAICWAIWSHTEAYYMMDMVDNIILPIFWICSGFTSRRDFKIRNKLKLIAYYFILSALCLLFAVFYAGKSLDANAVLGIFYARFMIYDAPLSASNPMLFSLYNGVLWFIPSLFTSYCVFRLLLKASTFRMQLVLCVASLCIAGALDFLPVLLPWSIDTAFVFAVFMCIGYWLRRYRIVERFGLEMALACLIIYLCLDRFTWLTNPSVRDYGLHWPSLMFTASFGVTSLLIFCKYLDRTWLARIAVAFDKEALFIFGLQLVFLKLITERTFGVIESWKLRIFIDIAGCFIGGYIVGKIYGAISGWLHHIRIRYKTAR